jgi:hypothetical protein
MKLVVWGGGGVVTGRFHDLVVVSLSSQVVKPSIPIRFLHTLHLIVFFLRSQLLPASYTNGSKVRKINAYCLHIVSAHVWELLPKHLNNFR